MEESSKAVYSGAFPFHQMPTDTADFTDFYTQEERRSDFKLGLCGAHTPSGYRHFTFRHTAEAYTFQVASKPVPRLPIDTFTLHRRPGQALECPRL